jgi:hypothetical protein
MEDGIISGNTVTGLFAAGGVGFGNTSGTVRFTKTGGTIYGYIEGNPLSNMVKNEAGDILTDRGAAIVLSPSGLQREKTIWPDQQMEFDGRTWIKCVDDDGVVTNQ